MKRVVATVYKDSAAREIDAIINAPINEVIEALFVQVAPPSERNALMDRLQEIHNRMLDEERHATT